MKERFLAGVMNRLFQLLARILPSRFRVRLHHISQVRANVSALYLSRRSPQAIFVEIEQAHLMGSRQTGTGNVKTSSYSNIQVFLAQMLFIKRQKDGLRWTLPRETVRQTKHAEVIQFQNRWGIDRRARFSVQLLWGRYLFSRHTSSLIGNSSVFGFKTSFDPCNESTTNGGMHIEESHLLRCRRLEHLEPSHHRISFYRRILHPPLFNPLEENIHWCSEVVQLNRCPKRPRAEPQGVSLRSAPRAPLDDDGEAKREKVPGEPPLESFDLSAHLFVIEIQRKGRHPFVWRETYRSVAALEPPGLRSLPRTRQAAHNNQPRAIS